MRQRSQQACQQREIGKAEPALKRVLQITERLLRPDGWVESRQHQRELTSISGNNRAESSLARYDAEVKSTRVGHPAVGFAAPVTLWHCGA
jgi:hypothetical protein